MTRYYNNSQRLIRDPRHPRRYVDSSLSNVYFTSDRAPLYASLRGDWATKRRNDDDQQVFW